jgi:hypothetical protein
MYEKARHECGVRYLCALRHKKGLAWFRKYISDHPKVHEFLIDFQTQYSLGNRGEWGCWKGTLSQQQGLVI